MNGMYGRRTVLGLGVALALPGCTQLPSWEHAPPVVLPGTRQIDIAASGPHSHVHRIMLAVPPSPPPPQGWPVLYMLDGNLAFAPIAQLMRNRFARGPGVAAPGAVVVGLGYAGNQVLDVDARTYDYTPPAPGPATDLRGRPEGGADAFLDFIDTTVRPLVKRAVHVDATRQTLFGHSYGGLCVLHALFTRPGTFQNYVAASPSVWWRDGFILQEQARFLAQRPANAPTLRLQVSQGAREAVLPTDAARAAIVRERRIAERLRALLDGLHGAPGLDLRFTTFPDADHGAAMLPAAQLALALSTENRS